MLAKNILLRNLKSILLIDESEMVQKFKRYRDITMMDIELQIQKFSISLIRSDKTLMYESVKKLNQTIEDVNMGFVLDDENNKRYQYMLK